MMTHRIETVITAIKVLESAETGFLVSPEVYDILKRYGINGRPLGLFGYVKIVKPLAEHLMDVLTELRKTLVEETLKACLKAMDMVEVDELMERLEGIVKA